MISKRIPDLENYMHTTADRWRWASAVGTDTPDIVAMAQDHFGNETDGIFVNDPIEYSRNVTIAIVNQFYNPRAELMSVARDMNTKQLLGYTWAVRGERAMWSREEMISIRIAHVDQTLSARERVFMCSQMIRMWEKWARACEINIIVSSSIRGDQQGFLKLHEAAGYVLKGSIGYKRLSTVLMDTEQVPDMGTITDKNTSYDPSKYTEAGKEHSISTKEFRAAG